jgi:NADH:ubiquinone oxidoreductase subunit 6 (subunit J)
MPNKSTSILIGGLIYAVVGLISAFLGAASGGMQYVGGALGCVALIAGAAGAVWHYTSTHRLTIPAGQGAVLGAGAGALGAAISGLVSWLLITAGVMPDPAEQARRQLEGQGLSEDQIATAMQMTEMFSGPLGIVVGLLVGALLGAIIGAIAALVFKKGDATPDVGTY